MQQETEAVNQTEVEVTEVQEVKNKKPWHFKSKSELGGQIDPKINMAGPAIGRKQLGITRRSAHQSELITLLRKLKPHNSAAILQAARIMNSPDTTDSNVLKASALIIQTYRQLLDDLYNGPEDTTEEVLEVQSKPRFSLTMVEQG